MLKVSIIVPVFNVKNYLCDCIASVMKQTHKEFELILVNDGSTDGSDEICNQYSLQYSKYIKIINIKNSGPLNARIIGIKEATGDILVFLDSDDCLNETALEKMVICFNKNECDMVMYDAGWSANFTSLPVSHPFENGKVFDDYSKKELYKRIVTGEIPNSVCLKAIRRYSVILPDRLLKQNLKNGEDLLLSAYFMTNCRSIVYLNNDLYYYRIREGSSVHTFDYQRLESIKIVHTELEKFIDIWEMPELKKLHNVRKVKSWIENLLLLIKNKNNLANDKFYKQLQSMGEDTYFLTAYIIMECSKLSKVYRILAYLLFKKQYFIFYGLSYVFSLVQKIKHRRFDAKSS